MDIYTLLLHGHCGTVDYTRMMLDMEPFSLTNFVFPALMTRSSRDDNDLSLLSLNRRTGWLDTETVECLVGRKQANK